MRTLLRIVFLFAFLHTAVAEETRTIDIRIEDRAVTDPGGAIRITQGESVVLRWHSDENVELHLHGYDVAVDVTANVPREMRLEAFASGRFPVTSHGFGGHSHGHETLLYLEVYPE